MTSSVEAPKYTGWNDWTGNSGSGSGSGSAGNGTSGSNGTYVGPTPGSAASNVTVPSNGTSSTSCNSAGNRSSWCNGKNIDTDYYLNDYLTGSYCTYDLTITNTTLDFDGTPRMALAVNGQVPGPAIECNWGDIVRITVHNEMQDNGTAIHWHGIRQYETNDQDGVPGVTECAIAPGTSRTYEWHASSYGTSWYHSHWATQYGDGIRGPIIIHGPATANYDIDMGSIMVDDLFDQTAEQTNWNIAHVGPGGTANYLLNGKNVKPDLSAGQHALWTVTPGKKHLFRFINSASQNMWSLHLDNHIMTVIAADFVPIVPYQTEWLNIGIGQRFDVIVEMNQPVDGYFLRAVTQLLCPSACVNTGLGNANGIISYEGAALTLPTSTAGNKTIADFNICEDEPLASLVPHLKKSAGTSSAFGASASTIGAGLVSQVQTADDGAVFRWFINNGAVDINYTQPTLQSLASYGSNSSFISNPIVLQQRNQWVYFVIQNQFFAWHPMHLHGHDFALLGQGYGLFNSSMVSTLNFNNPMRRDTAMLAGAPGGAAAQAGYTVIGFETDNPGAWLMHCHIVWHVDGGLALQWIERPDDIPAKGYTSKQSFQDECSAYNAYEAEGAYRVKTTGESGLRRRYMDEMLSSHSGDVVRRSGEKHFFEHVDKRGVSGYSPRHMRK